MDIKRSEKPQNNNESSSSENNTSNQQSSGGSADTQKGGGSGMMGPILTIIGLVAIALALVLVFSDGEMDDAMTTDESGPVATVGGEEIDRSVFEEQLNALQSGTSSQAQQFQQLEETRQQSLILSNLINQELLTQAAENAGVSVSDSELDSELQSQIEQIGGEEEFQSQLENNDLTREEVRNNLRDQLLISQYVEQESGGATDQQVQQLYDQLIAQVEQAGGTSTNQQTPSLEQVRPQLEARILQQSRQQLLQQAREQIDVEVMLDGVSYPPETQAPQQPQQRPQPQPQQGAQQQQNTQQTQQAPQQQNQQEAGTDTTNTNTQDQQGTGEDTQTQTQTDSQQ